MDWKSILIFVGLNFIMVVLSSLRSITTAKAGRHVAAFFNWTSYTAYAIIVKLTTNQSLVVVIITTALCNLIGYYLSDYIFTKMQKDRVWQITTQPLFLQMIDEIRSKFDEKKIKYVVQFLDHKVAVLVIYSYSQNESLIIKDILKESGSVKTFINEMIKQL